MLSSVIFLYVVLLNVQLEVVISPRCGLGLGLGFVSFILYLWNDPSVVLESTTCLYPHNCSIIHAFVGL